MKENKAILFFDGHCNLCNSVIDLVVRRDKDRQILVASLQGEAARQKLPQETREKMSSVVLFEPPGKLSYKSAAVFRIARILRGRFLLLLPFWILPRFFTDWIYDLVAHNRYRLFGQRNTCRIPTEDEKSHFLE